MVTFCRLGGVMVTFSPPTQQTGVRFPAVAGRPVTRLYLVQLRLEMHTPWFVGLTPTASSVPRYGVAEGYRKGDEHLRQSQKMGATWPCILYLFCFHTEIG